MVRHYRWTMQLCEIERRLGAEKGIEPLPCQANEKGRVPSQARQSMPCHIQKASDIEPFDSLLSHQFCVGQFDLLPGGLALIALKVPLVIVVTQAGSGSEEAACWRE
jgi:hypothetical protein